MTALEMLDAFELLNHWAIQRWISEGADLTKLTRASQSQTGGDLVDYVRLRALGQPVPDKLVSDILALADAARLETFKRVHATLGAPPSREG